ncbi:UDP-2,4-diacetamido-2,4,6-trideoxy-beta-L-altropyranose hydrolase [Vibrio coralliilyticus]|uniref:UDP-2,4-diacetamido-2,4, 6-trideoxy-beta-L-altropyranose hydrolase n=1 Tax=Vibrio coralliilyticus TaxID=190893 RepID=UPI000512770A|nr:UDP-2,4-diacetamido-2,4,6-trideoxy-beta-L-altropyranose hydrolase [Vibrio coralliilyticus]AIU68115.1 acetylneuraminate cytidylyltransferase [Vibrio coralliilyticus]
MKVVFRVDASIYIGSGHVMRCLVLADELKKRGAEVKFSCIAQQGDMIDFIEKRGYKVEVLHLGASIYVPSSPVDYVGWLRRSVIEDAKDFVATLISADLVITDHYAIGREWQDLVIDSMNCRLLAIDDLARCHRADLILDQTLGRLESDYNESKAPALVGSDYALLQPRFSIKREVALSRALSNDKPNVLISMGGVDAPNATLKALNVLHPNVSANFTVLLSPRSPNFQQVATWCSRYSNVTHLDFVSDMAGLMLEHDIAIGAPGTTSWERACLGLPNVIVPLADNQQMISEELVKYGAAIKVDIEDIPSRLLSSYQTTLRHWEAFKLANLSICDGRGVKRVVFEIEQLFSVSDDSYCLEKATQQDIKQVYEWQCHSETRKYALNTNIPSWVEHHEWMCKKLQSPSDYFYMVIDKESGEKVGVVRLDRKRAGHYLVSIFIDPISYGKGIASEVLKLVDLIYPDITLHAKVLKANLASQRLFQKACYQQTDEETYVRHPIY